MKAFQLNGKKGGLNCSGAAIHPRLAAQVFPLKVVSATVLWRIAMHDNSIVHPHRKQGSSAQNILLGCKYQKLGGKCSIADRASLAMLPSPILHAVTYLNMMVLQPPDYPLTRFRCYTLGIAHSKHRWLVCGILSRLTFVPLAEA